MTAVYDTIGLDYAALRRPDPRIAAAIHAALGPAASAVNVGAGAGSYEPTDRRVVAVEPSIAMIRQRPPGAAPVVQATAEALPFADGTFDAATAILTVHHWADRRAGLAELRRVARGPIVLFTFDPTVRPWPVDYWPEFAALDEAHMPRIDDYARWLGDARVVPVPIPHDCTDGFLYAYWRRPAAYLDARVRAGSSTFWALGERAEPGLAALQRDLASGAWQRRYGDVLTCDTCDAGYRLIVSG